MNLSEKLSGAFRVFRFQKEAPHLALGKWGEKHAESYLRKNTSLKLLGRRVRVGKHDELDLLAREGSLLVVIEVKTRATEGLRPAKDAVGRKKQWNLNRAAVKYASSLNPRPDGIRFDIVEVIGAPGAGPVDIRHHPGAFGLHRCFRF